MNKSITTHENFYAERTVGGFSYRQLFVTRDKEDGTLRPNGKPEQEVHSYIFERVYPEGESGPVERIEFPFDPELYMELASTFSSAVKNYIREKQKQPI